MNPSDFFIQESLTNARRLPLPEARLFLRGMLEMIGECPEAHDIRDAFVLLDESDRQLELIAKRSEPKR